MVGAIIFAVIGGTRNSHRNNRKREYPQGSLLPRMVSSCYLITVTVILLIPTNRGGGQQFDAREAS